jgi:hypothetical protein
MPRSSDQIMACKGLSQYQIALQTKVGLQERGNIIAMTAIASISQFEG